MRELQRDVSYIVSTIRLLKDVISDLLDSDEFDRLQDYVDTEDEPSTDPLYNELKNTMLLKLGNNEPTERDYWILAKSYYLKKLVSERDIQKGKDLSVSYPAYKIEDPKTFNTTELLEIEARESIKECCDCNITDELRGNTQSCYGFVDSLGEEYWESLINTFDEDRIDPNKKPF